MSIFRLVQRHAALSTEFVHRRKPSSQPAKWQLLLEAGSQVNVASIVSGPVSSGLSVGMVTSVLPSNWRAEAALDEGVPFVFGTRRLR